MTGVAKNTIVTLLADVGSAGAKYQDAHLRNLPCKRIQCDEIWAFVGAKEKNIPAEKRGQFGMAMFGLGLRFVRILRLFLLGL